MKKKKCPKCGYTSGNDWSQCGGSCPMPGSPHYGKEVVEERGPKCDCGQPSDGEHTCPFKEEINNDYETKCNCCAECQHQCAMDI